MFLSYICIVSIAAVLLCIFYCAFLQAIHMRGPYDIANLYLYSLFCIVSVVCIFYPLFSKPFSLFIILFADSSVATW